MTSRAAASWDAEYRAGRYAGEPPVDVVEDILAAAADLPDGARGLYVGCGNGRNFLPLVDAGLDLTGLDISAVALADLARRAPEHAGRLVHGTVDDLPEGERFDLVSGIQVFQHGDRAAAHAHLLGQEIAVRTAEVENAPGAGRDPAGEDGMSGAAVGGAVALDAHALAARKPVVEGAQELFCLGAGESVTGGPHDTKRRARGRR